MRITTVLGGVTLILVSSVALAAKPASAPLVLSQEASANTVTSISWFASNNWAGKDWCEDECLENLLREMGTEDPSGEMTVRSSNSQTQVNSKLGNGSISVRVVENDGTEDRYCGFQDVMTVNFGFDSFSSGSIRGGGFRLCGDAALGFSSFQPPEGEYGILRGEIYGDGWELTGYVEGVTTRTVPEPGTLTLKISTVAGCRSVTGTITLAEPAPPAGVLVVLGDTLPSAFVPASLTIPAGATSKSFTITTVPVKQQQSGTVGAMIGREPLMSKVLTVRPMSLSFITLSPKSVAGGNQVSGKATLECIAGPGPIEVVLASSNAALANPVASSIFVPQGMQTATFDVSTNAVLTKTSATISGTANGITKARLLALTPAAAVSPASLKFVGVPVGTTSGVLNATLTNKGATAFSVTGITLTGTGAAYFAKSSNCGATLAAGASCTIGVIFKPTTTFSKSAKISIATSATATPLSVTLSGKGI